MAPFGGDESVELARADGARVPPDERDARALVGIRRRPGSRAPRRTHRRHPPRHLAPARAAGTGVRRRDDLRHARGLRRRARERRRRHGAARILAAARRAGRLRAGLRRGVWDARRPDRRPARDRAPVNGRSSRVAVVLIYAVVVVWVAVHHEPWRDEVVPLSIARNAHSLAELAAPLRFEGHPILWYLLLWCSYRLVGSVAVLKAASLGCAIGGIALLNAGPLPWWIRVPFTFSFFPLYQYSVVSRGYSLELLLLFVFCALFPRRREHPVLVALVLGALANTEAFGLVIAVAAAGMLTVEALTRGAAVPSARGVVAVAVFLAGLALAVGIAS